MSYTNPQNKPPTWVVVSNMDPRESTERAILCLDDDGNEIWVPKSVIHSESPVQDPFSGRGDIILRGWFARKEDMAFVEYFTEAEL